MAPQSYALRAALAFALAAALAVAVVERREVFADPLSPLSAALAGALVGAACWHLLARGPVPVGRGALVGAAVGLCSHLPFQLLYVLSKMARGREGWSLQTLLGGTLLFGISGMLFTGWITAPIGAATGALLAWTQRPRDGAAPPAL